MGRRKFVKTLSGVPPIAGGSTRGPLARVSLVSAAAAVCVRPICQKTHFRL